MLYIIGLGNPGSKYARTRHNVAWILLENIYHPKWEYQKYMKAWIAHQGEATLVKPDTYMNKSGEVLDFLQQKKDLSLENCVVIHDDVDLPFGKVRLSHNRGSGGHNGVKSITKHLGSASYTRLRIGIAQEHDGHYIKPQVLGVFNDEEYHIVSTKISEHVKDILAAIQSKGAEYAMNVYNQ